MLSEKRIEEQAEEYVIKTVCKTECPVWNLHSGCTIPRKECHYTSNRLKGYIDGAKWGMEHATEWHDIESHVLPKREISKKYMPKANEKVMLKYHFYNETEIHYSDGYYDMFDFEFHIPNNPTGRIICVIAWCELPQFKE